MARAPIDRPPPNEAPVRIKGLVKGVTVRAQLEGFDPDLRRLGGIDVEWNQISSHMIDIGVLTEISLGSVHLDVASRRYEWSMSGVTIYLDVENAEAILGSYYRDVPQEGHYEIAQQSERSVHDKNEVSGDVKADAGAVFNKLPFVKFLVSGRGGASADRARDQKDTTHTKTTPIVATVERQGEAWRAEDASAGALRTRTRDLRGTIVHPYRKSSASDEKSRRDLDAEVPTPLVRLRAKDPTKPVFGFISVRADREDFVIDAGKPHADPSKFIEDALSADKSAWLKRRAAALVELRTRIAALSAAPKIGGARSGAGEFDLFGCAFCFEPDVDEAKSGGGA